MIRIGLGYDSHRFDPSRPLVLGGVNVPDFPGLAGHSDADVVLHAITDALLGGRGWMTSARFSPTPIRL